jgi:flagellar basal body rod protein FlgG
MTDRIFEIGKAGLESSDQRVHKMMDNMINEPVPGYKKTDAVVRGFPFELDAADKRLTAMIPQVDDTYTDNTAGTLAKTNNKLDLALGSKGFFVLQAPWGEGYTRDGRFHLDRDGRLLSVAGNLPVLGHAGPIMVPEGSDVQISQSGQVLVDGVEVDSIRVVVPQNYKAFESMNGSLFKLNGRDANIVEVENPHVIQGYVEASNVSIVDQTMTMMMLERVYTINSKIIQTRDANLSKAMDLGKASP